MLRNHVYDWNYSVKSIETFTIRCHKTNTPYMRSFVTLFSTFTTTHYLMWRMQCVIYISNISQYYKNEERLGRSLFPCVIVLWKFFIHYLFMYCFYFFMSKKIGSKTPLPQVARVIMTFYYNCLTIHFYKIGFKMGTLGFL